MTSLNTNRSASAQVALDRLVQWYEQLTPGHLVHLDAYYAPDAHFKDPFNDVSGLPAIRQVFTHMFTTLDQPRFVVTRRLLQGDQAFLVWEFHFRFRRWRVGIPQCVHGVTHVLFDTSGLVVLHRDYWDAAEELYEKLPLVGILMRWLRQRAGR